MPPGEGRITVEPDGFVWYHLEHLAGTWEVRDGVFVARCCDCGWLGEEYDRADPAHYQHQADLDAMEHRRDSPLIRQ